jgi:hypothetical protein
MNEMKYQCEICNKGYSSKSSFSNHKKLYHNTVIKENVYNCRYCEKNYTKRQSRWVHEKKCILIENANENDIDKILEENEMVKEERNKLKDQVIKLQSKLLKTNRLDTKTFKAINKLLMERSYNNSHNNITNSNNVINNNIQQICNIGNEELINVLTEQEKRQILNAKYNALERIVEIAHCGEYNQFKNIIITNLKDNFAYKYDQAKKYFITIEKNELIDAVVLHRITDIEAIYDELKDANKIDERTKRIIQEFLDNCNSDEPYTDKNGIKYPNFKSYKNNSIKILLYNNQDRITKDIALLITDNE